MFYAKQNKIKSIKLTLNRSQLDRDSNKLKVRYHIEAFKVVRKENARVEDVILDLEIVIQLKEDFSEVNDNLIQDMLSELTITQNVGGIFITTGLSEVYEYELAFNVALMTILNTVINQRKDVPPKQDKKELDKVINILRRYGASADSGKRGRLMITELGSKSANFKAITLHEKNERVMIELYNKDEYKGRNSRWFLVYDIDTEESISITEDEYRRYPNGTKSILEFNSRRFGVGLTQQKYQDFYKHYSKILELIR